MPALAVSAVWAAHADSGVSTGVFSTNLILMYFPTAYGDITKADENDNKDLGE